MVNDQPYFEEAFIQFQKWLEATECWNSVNKSIFVTSGDWDLQVMLPKQCQLSNIDIPSEMKHWINIKKVILLEFVVRNMPNARRTLLWSNFLPKYCKHMWILCVCVRAYMCVYGTTGWGLLYRTHTHHRFKITLPNTDQAHDKHQ